MGRDKIRQMEQEEVLRHFDFETASFAFNEFFNKESTEDHSIALLASSFLEMALEHMLRGFLPEKDKEVEKLFSINGPLSTFSGKISMSYSVGLIEKTIMDDLHLVRKIRNAFAHQLYANFERDDIVKLCQSLKWHKLVFVANPPKEATAKQLFHVGVNQVISYLSGAVSLARGGKRQVRNNF